MPLFFIGMCTFISNDLDDIERDIINHPERPLPSGLLKPSFAAALYFVCLGSALFATKFYIKSGASFLYYLLLILSISYGYIVDHFPGFKSTYVAATMSIPVLIVATYLPNEKRLYLVAGAVFFFIMGREICMNFLDRIGDAASFVHKIEPRLLGIIAFSLQVIGWLLLAVKADGLLDAIDLLAIGSLFALSGSYWFKRVSHKRAVVVMNVQLFLGVYFLL